MSRCVYPAIRRIRIRNPGTSAGSGSWPPRFLQGEANQYHPLSKLGWVLAVVLHHPLSRGIHKAPAIASNNPLTGLAQGVRLPQHTAQR